MSLNDINLPAGTIAGLFKNVLIAGEEQITAYPDGFIKNKSVVSFLGNNKKRIAVLVNYPDAVFIPDEQLTFLTNILTACKLSLDDIAIINFGKINAVPYKVFLNAVPSQSVLFFGLKPEILSLPANFPPFQVQLFDGVNYLKSPALEELGKDKTLKAQLWTSLKRIFNIN